MNRKTLIIIVSAVLIVTLGVSGYLYLTRKSTPNPLGGISVFPGGSSVNFPGGGGSGTTTETPWQTYVPGSSAPTPRLYELHTLPVAGVGLFESGKNPALVINARYIERGLGNIFETRLDTLVETRISNETRPRLAEAFWGNMGKSVATRFLDDNNVIKTRIINIGAPAIAVGTTTPNTGSTFLKTEEVFLPDDILFVATAEDRSDNLFFLKSGVGTALGLVSNYINSKVSNVFDSAFTEWLPQMPNQKLVTLTTKPSSFIPGHLFFVDLPNKTAKKVLGDISGLTTLTSPDGAWVLYSETLAGAPQLSVYNVLKKETHKLSQQTISDKCVWSTKNKGLIYCAVPQSLPAGDYPDQWYQGVLSFSDTLWEIDATTQSARPIMSPSSFGAPSLDIINLQVSSDNSYLVFMNKISGTPWVYRLVESVPLLSQTTPTTPGGVPASVITPDMQKIR